MSAPWNTLLARVDHDPRRGLTAPERLLWDAYPTGTPISLGEGRPVGVRPGRTVRAEVISALLLGVRDGARGQVPAVRLRGARIIGRFDVSGGEIGCELRLEDCVLEERPDFSNARARQTRIKACAFPGFDGGGLRVDGFLSLSESLIDGELRLTRATLTGGLRVNNARIRNPGGYAIFGGGLVVEAGTFVRNSDITGTVRLTGARMGGGLFLQGTTLRDPGCALDGDNLVVQDRMECSAGFTCEGPVRLRGCRIDGTLSFDHAAIHAPGRRALHLSHSRVEELILTPRTPIQGEVTLGYSRIDVILDRPDVWPTELRLNGLVYETLRGETAEAERLDWVARDPHGFRPQPYEQLAGWLRRIGRDDLALRCQLAKQRARRRSLGPISRAWGVVLDWTVGYGYRPWIAAVWLVVLVAAGTTVFSVWHPHTIRQAEERPHFHALIYTLDLMVPIETFGQRSAWDPVGWTRWPAWGLTGAGWLLATALISGVARVLRRS